MLIKGVKLDRLGNFKLPPLALDSEKDAEIIALFNANPRAFKRALVMYAKEIILGNIEAGEDAKAN